MFDLRDLFAEKDNDTDGFNFMQISLASPETIRSWSHGEVKKPETINYRTFKPERDGLFCAKIFGPIKNYECLCGKYKRIKHRGVVCEKCGVEVTSSKVRRERMGHIELASPVAHIWFLKSLPSRLGMILDMALKDVSHVLYFEAYVVIEVLDLINPPHNVKRGTIVSPEQYNIMVENGDADKLKVGIGATAIKEILESIDIEKEIISIQREIASLKSDTNIKRCVKRLRLLEGFRRANMRPEWMILDVIPVLPPELRPLVALDGGKFATSDLNDLYRRVINRNNRLKRLMQLRAPEIILRNERRMLQEAVDSLFDNGKRGKAVIGINKRPLKSLAEMIKGKSGRFRQNLLGKRVDYSGRSVITVGPNLKLYQCGLPKSMALELFKPFVYHKLQALGHVNSIKYARHMVEEENPIVWDVLESIIYQHPVLLNRAPTLHRLGIQAFEPILIEGKAIQLHPLVCAAFNADFDGDQMAVHVPLSLEAQAEARILMLASNNILSPANGDPIIVPSQDIVLGLYYMTREKINALGEGSYFADVNELERAYMTDQVSIHAAISVRIPHYTKDEEGNYTVCTLVRRKTTVGRAILSKIIPKGFDFELINKPLKKKEVAKLINIAFRKFGNKATVILADKLMYTGFEYSTKAGVSVCVDDMHVPASKQESLANSRREVHVVDEQYNQGLLTQGERYNKVIDIWSRCGDQISKTLMQELSTEKVKDKDGNIVEQESFNSIYIMADSGARGSMAQIKQLSGMRGLMAKPSGEIIEDPITANFREGLTVSQYFISTHGARKGLSDTALKTANSGYLTRRLASATDGVVITKEDCGTTQGIEMRAIVQGGDVVESLRDRILGRVLAEDLIIVESNTKIASAGDQVDEDMADTIDQYNVDSIKVRTALTCEVSRGLCAQCYGRDLATGKRVNVGTAVGIMAAQSIGEPGTQLTMRTFHIGGAVSRSVVTNNVEIKVSGAVHFNNLRYIKKTDGQLVVVSRMTEIVIIDSYKREKEKHAIPYGATLNVNEGDHVQAGQQVATWDPHIRPMISEYAGTVSLQNFEEGVTVVKETDEFTGLTVFKVIDASKNKSSKSKKKVVNPAIMLFNKDGTPVNIPQTDKPVIINLQIGNIINVRDGDWIEEGHVIAKKPRDGNDKIRDITGGLPRVVDLFEARIPKDPCIMAPMSGILHFQKETKANKQKLKIVSLENETVELVIHKDKNILINDGEYVTMGQVIVDGPIDPHELLKMKGAHELMKYICSEIQDVYRLQGVKINDKYIEIVVTRMIKFQITDNGDSLIFNEGDVLDKAIVVDENDRLVSEDKKPMQYQLVLLGITRACLNTSDSFLAAASFQDTTRVLTNAAIMGQVTYMRRDIKTCVIVGDLIDAGTGFWYHRAKHNKNADVDFSSGIDYKHWLIETSVEI